MAQSLVNDAEQSGAFPRWPLANVATGEMTGDNVVPLIVSFYAYGAKDFDVKTALHYMVNAATKGGIGLGGYVERPGIETYLRLGYAPHTWSSAALDRRRLDHAGVVGRRLRYLPIRRLARRHGDRRRIPEPGPVLAEPVQSHHPLHLAAQRDSDFSATAPGFVRSPTGFGQDGFDEGNAEQYVWWVPHNVAGLVTALGGRQAVAGRLDRFTKKLNEGPDEPYLWAGNEPGFGVPWLYNYIGQPWKTQHTVDRVRGLFGPTPDGEPGNDDLGAMASWYVWAALGLYPITPGTPILTVSTPLFDRAVIALPGGKSIRMFAPGASGPHPLKYISGLKIDGQATDHTWLPESIIHTGGELTFSLAAHPDKAWGTDESSAPPSFGAGSSAVTVNVSRPIVDDRPGKHRHRDPRRTTDDRRRQGLHDHRHVLRQRDHRGTCVGTVRLRRIGRH